MSDICIGSLTLRIIVAPEIRDPMFRFFCVRSPSPKLSYRDRETTSVFKIHPSARSTWFQLKPIECGILPFLCRAVYFFSAYHSLLSLCWNPTLLSSQEAIKYVGGLFSGKQAWSWVAPASDYVTVCSPEAGRNCCGLASIEGLLRPRLQGPKEFRNSEFSGCVSRPAALGRPAV